MSATPPRPLPHHTAARLHQESLSSPDGQHAWVGGGPKPVLFEALQPDGTIDAAAAVAVGTISLSGIAPQRILGVVPADQARIAREVLTGPIEAKLTTAGGAERQALLSIASGGLRAGGHRRGHGPGRPVVSADL